MISNVASYCLTAVRPRNSKIDEDDPKAVSVISVLLGLLNGRYGVATAYVTAVLAVHCILKVHRRIQLTGMWALRDEALCVFPEKGMSVDRVGECET